ncbi:MAG: hypothetical protein Q4D13_06715 [Erysipelotrichaceae bacterium]|nr:hypothetical protein [Erysipelotrichaceae bacterium]
MNKYYINGIEVDPDKTALYYLNLNPELKKKILDKYPLMFMLVNKKVNDLIDLYPDKDNLQRDINMYVKMIEDKGYKIVVKE